MESWPSGPLTVTVDSICSGVGRTFFGSTGRTSEKLTSEGTATGALPICDWVAVVAENALAEAAEAEAETEAEADWKAGARKAGIEVGNGEADALNASRELVENMAAAVATAVRGQSLAQSLIPVVAIPSSR